MISTIMVYKFANLSREEIDAMLGTKLEDTRVFREAKEEERRSMALKMLQEGATLEFVTKVSGFTIEQIQALQAQENQDA
jgi:predicted transposase YdaD